MASSARNPSFLNEPLVKETGFQKQEDKPEGWKELTDIKNGFADLVESVLGEKGGDVVRKMPNWCFLVLALMLACGILYVFKKPLEHILIPIMTLCFYVLFCVGLPWFVMVRIAELLRKQKHNVDEGYLRIFGFLEKLWKDRKRNLVVQFPIAHLIAKWVIPMMVTATGQFIMMWLLHIATYYYILYMKRFEEEVHKSPSLLQHLHERWLSPGIGVNSTSFGAVEDVIESFLPVIDVKLSILDGIAALLPMCFVAGAISAKDLTLWTKVFLCHALLCVSKGIIDMMTVMPDSIGWKKCQDRLNANGGMQLMLDNNTVRNPHEYGFLANVIDLLMLEVAEDTKGKTIRFCSDMMLSGHTFVTCLYALGLLELIHRVNVRTKVSDTFYWICLVFVISEQILEISMVLLTRFHYSADIFVAIMCTLLWYTNGPLIIYAKWWSCSFGESQMTESEGVIWIPPCCIPFCDPQGSCCGGEGGYHSIQPIKDEEVMLQELRRMYMVSKVTWQERDGNTYAGIIVEVSLDDGDDDKRDRSWTSESFISGHEHRLYKILGWKEDDKSLTELFERKARVCKDTGQAEQDDLKRVLNSIEELDQHHYAMGSRKKEWWQKKDKKGKEALKSSLGERLIVQQDMGKESA